ncbi:hypothetical protein RMSM_02460 [Rhodopirellula maiorica SM1]|uniref:Uncharacterized protein n=1 Tax=Rhodopirellula maiorica SM1 TaxID=1265738 RepID=M5RMR0_9BACT|nr:hypothetical protein RMSM_02460 [Rhodopirellula maiorica SM1]
MKTDQAERNGKHGKPIRLLSFSLRLFDDQPRRNGGHSIRASQKGKNISLYSRAQSL